jgi:hypothetical protein
MVTSKVGIVAYRNKEERVVRKMKKERLPPQLGQALSPPPVAHSRCIVCNRHTHLSLICHDMRFRIKIIIIEIRDKKSQQER